MSQNHSTSTTPDVKLLFGPMLIGSYFNAILYGIVVMQTFIYYQTYRKDPKWLRYFVLYLMVCETLNTAFDMGLMYEPLVLKYESPEALRKAPIMLNADAIVTVLISTPVQLFVCWRIKIIGKSRLIPSFIIFFAFSSFVGGLATTICVSIIPEYSRFHQFEGAVITWLTASAITDVIITFSLMWYLHARKTSIPDTDEILNRIIRLTLQTGALTTLFAILDVVSFLSFRNTTTQFIWDFSLSKLYTNSLLSTLNARSWWSEIGASPIQLNPLFHGTRTTNPQEMIPRHRLSDDKYNHSSRITSMGFQVPTPVTEIHHL